MLVFVNFPQHPLGEQKNLNLLGLKRLNINQRKGFLFMETLHKNRFAFQFKHLRLFTLVRKFILKISG